MIRRDGEFVEVAFEEALDHAATGLGRVREESSANQIALYAGNPIIHDMSSLLSLPMLLQAIGTGSFYTAASVDTLPKNLACALLFGSPEAIPVPDVDRTDFLLVFGANPMVSNGSVMMAPDLPGRLARLRERGGRLVVVDPRRNETAAKADAHYFIRPGTDAFVLLAMIHTLFAENRVDLAAARSHAEGLEELRAAVRRFAPERVARQAGIGPDVIRRLALELADAERGVCYGRIGTCTQRFGTVASWAIDVLNILAGHLDRPGGAMFARPAASLAMLGSGSGALPYDRFRTQVRGPPEFDGQLPVAALAEEIDQAETPIRALVTLAGNPALSAPNSRRLVRAMEGLEFMVSLDYYLNETTRLANVILPPTSPLERSNCDLFVYPVAVRNVVHYSPPALDAGGGGGLDPWVTAFELSARLMGGELDPDRLAEGYLESIAKGLGIAEECHEGRSGPDRVLDLMLRAGPYKTRLGDLNPHGVDFGALEPGLDRVIARPSGRIDLLPNLIGKDLERVHDALAESPPRYLMIGRRSIRSNNSWMHNIASLAKGRPRCTLIVHPDDAAELGVSTKESLEVRSQVGAIRVAVEVSDEIMRGVVSLPHGFGHDEAQVRLRVATTKQRGVNTNVLTSNADIDEISGTPVFNGVPVELAAVK